MCIFCDTLYMHFYFHYFYCVYIFFKHFLKASFCSKHSLSKYVLLLYLLCLKRFELTLCFFIIEEAFKTKLQNIAIHLSTLFSKSFSKDCKCDFRSLTEHSYINWLSFSLSHFIKLRSLLLIIWSSLLFWTHCTSIFCKFKVIDMGK